MAAQVKRGRRTKVNPRGPSSYTPTPPSGAVTFDSTADTFDATTWTFDEN